MYAGKKLKQLRQRLELNQLEFSTSLGLSQSYYSAVEAGKRKITPKMIEKITEKWGIDKKYFMSDDSSKMRGKNEGYNEGVISKNVANERLIYLHKFTLELSKERPDLSELKSLISELGAYSIDLEHIFTSYLESCLKGVDTPSAKNYLDYKKKNINHLEQFLKYKKILTPIVKSLERLIEVDFPPHDIKGVLKGD